MAGNTKPSLERAGDRDKALEAALVQIERQMHGIERHVVFPEERRSPLRKDPVFLRSPLDAVVHHQEIDVELFRFFKSPADNDPPFFPIRNL